MKQCLFLFASLLFLYSCYNTPSVQRTAITRIDTTLKPGDGFYRYANRLWYDTAKIPPSQSGVGAYMFVNYPQRPHLQSILDSVSKADNHAGSLEQKTGEFFASGTDTVTIN